MINEPKCKPFYDCNRPSEIDGYRLIELSEDIYKYEKITEMSDDGKFEKDAVAKEEKMIELYNGE